MSSQFFFKFIFESKCFLIQCEYIMGKNISMNFKAKPGEFEEQLDIFLLLVLLGT